MPSTWNKRQHTYWDQIAPRYDSFYTGAWAKLENDAIETVVVDCINTVQSLGPVNIIDFGCGTGLGALFSQRADRPFAYTGVDISRRMLTIAQKQLSHLQPTLLCCAMEKVEEVSSQSQHVALCLFTALSFSENPQQAIAEMLRVLRAGGCVIVSALGRFSLRRLVRLRLARREAYQTRGDSSALLPPPAHTFSSRTLTRLLTEAGFQVKSVFGISCLADITTSTKFWSFDVALCRRMPNTGHMLFAVAAKP